MNQPKYTFLLPAYKARFFEEALLSIKNQTYKDFKVIVSDDCSPEGLKSIYDKVCADDPRFTFRRNKENMGSKSLVSHWNLLVDMCETEFLIMASDDDIYESLFLEEINKLTEKYPNLDLFRARAKRIENGIITIKDYNLDEYIPMCYFLTCFGGKKMVHCLANYVFRTCRLKEIDNFPDFPKATYSDSAAAMLMAKNGIAITKDILFTFRISSINLSSSQGYNKNIIEVANADLMFIDWYNRFIIEEIRKININEYLMHEINMAHKNHIENILLYLLPLMKMTDLVCYLKKFRKKGYMQEKLPYFSILKNWIRSRSLLSIK